MGNIAPMTQATAARRTARGDGVYLVINGIGYVVTPRILAECLWDDGMVTFGDEPWATRILANLMRRGLGK